MTPEQLELEIKHLATKADLHQELHALTWRFIGLLVTAMIGQTTVILSAVYFMINHHTP
jgi:hypothetical protein